MSTDTDHAAIALEHVDKADEWANRDSAALEYRDRMIDRHLRLAQIHATLSVAQQVSAIPDVPPIFPGPL